MTLPVKIIKIPPQSKYCVQIVQLSFNNVNVNKCELVKNLSQHVAVIIFTSVHS